MDKKKREKKASSSGHGELENHSIGQRKFEPMI